jgi:hypothetical protein
MLVALLFGLIVRSHSCAFCRGFFFVIGVHSCSFARGLVLSILFVIVIVIIVIGVHSWDFAVVVIGVVGIIFEVLIFCIRRNVLAVVILGLGCIRLSIDGGIVVVSLAITRIFGVHVLIIRFIVTVISVRGVVIQIW